MADIGTIRMRSPGGKPTCITVATSAKGGVDIHFTRTSEGEALVSLPSQIAKQLGDLLAKASASLPSPERDR
jgi:hypothetical protein